MGEGVNAVKSSSYFPECNAVVKLKSKQGQDALQQKAVARPRETNEMKKITSKLEKGIEFYCEWPEGKKRDFVVFSMTSKTVIFVIVQIRKVIFCKKRSLFCVIGYPFWKDYLLNAHNWQLRQCSRDWDVLKQCSLVRPVFASTSVSGLNNSIIL